MTSVIQSLGHSEQHDLKVLANVLLLFRNVRNAMPVQHVQTLLAVAIAEDSTVNEISEATNVPAHLTSRQLSDLGDLDRYHQPGLDLVVTRPNLQDRRSLASG